MLYNVPNPIIRTQFSDSAYNGGINGVLRDRRTCGLAANCNPNLWFNNVELYCSKSKKILYGNKSACDINREHVENVFIRRIKKYNQCYY